MAKTNGKEQALLLDQDRGKPWIQFFDSIENLPIRKETLEFCCVHIPQLKGALGLCCVHMP